MRRLLLILPLFCCLAAFTQTGTRSLPATSVAKAPVLDGKLDEPLWQEAPIAGNFIINQPAFGEPSAQKTEVRLVYTNEAIYVGAMLYDDPAKIRRQLTSRDQHEMQDTDVFGIALDTYNDNQNAFAFIVTAANVQSDGRISPSNDGDTDFAWDAVWNSAVRITDNGWIAEIRIPYSAIRFAQKPLQTWGMNFYRFIRRTNENSYWNTVDPKISGFVNQCGDLTALRDLKPPVRLSFLPYVSGGYRTIPTSNGRINEWLRSGGMDVKYGVNESFTLDMTLIPDFGQVQSDNVVLNLSPYEVQFNENRPFFTEGTELFNKAGIFYSRRIGSTPGGYYDARQLAADSNYTIIKNPSVTQLYNATKFSGRTKHNLGIGIFNAVTAPAEARFENRKGELIKMQTEPLTNYSVFVLDQAFKNRSSISLTNTNVLRNGHARDANVTALDISLYDKKNNWNVQLKPRFSYVTGADAYNGWKNYLGIDKVSGKWQFGAWNNIESDRFDPNDLGILFSANEVSMGAYVNWQQFTPNKKYNYRSYYANIQQAYLYKPFAYTSTKINTNFVHVFRNFWDVSLEMSYQPFWENDYFDLRTEGRFYKKTPYMFLGLFGSTDSRKKLFVRYGVGHANLSPIKNDPFYLLRLGARYRFNPKFSVDIDCRREDDLGNIGFSHFDNNGQPVIGLRRILTYNTIFSSVYNFKARMNLTFRARHYWSRVTYKELYDPKTDGWWTNRPYEAGHDRNFNVFNIDAFYTWDFKPGSRLLVAWKNALGPDVSVDGALNTKYTQNLRRVFTNPHSNELSVKFIYYIDYLTLKKRKAS